MTRTDGRGRFAFEAVRADTEASLRLRVRQPRGGLSSARPVSPGRTDVRVLIRP